MYVKKNIDLKYNHYGKLFLKNSNIKFSLSHSNNYCAIAISNNIIGVDIEFIRKINYRKISMKYFHENEINKINNITDFFKIWTRKESLYKLTKISNFNLYDTSSNYLNIKKEKVFFRTFSFFRDYIFSIAFLRKNNINIFFRRKID